MGFIWSQYKLEAQYGYRIPLSYKNEEFVIAGCELETNICITTKLSSSRLSYDIHVKFNWSNRNHVHFLDRQNLCGLYNCLLDRVKNHVGMKCFNPKILEAYEFRDPIYCPQDDVTGEYIPRRCPSIFLPLISRGILSIHGCFRCHYTVTQTGYHEIYSINSYQTFSYP